MSEEMRDRVAIVTGGSSGIGRSTALAFAERGARVVIADVSVETGEETVKKIRESEGEAIFLKTDVSRADDVERMVEMTLETYDRLDYAFNNAGIEGDIESTIKCSEENWDRTININLKGVWLCMKYEIPAMLSQGGGSIVNNASVAGLVGFEGLPAYTASKGGVVQLTKTAALEYAQKGIRVNAVCPGVIRTPMVDRIIGDDREKEASFTAMEPMGRLGRPEEVAEAVVWLCSENASFVTGHALVVDGGIVAR